MQSYSFCKMSYFGSQRMMNNEHQNGQQNQQRSPSVPIFYPYYGPPMMRNTEQNIRYPASQPQPRSSNPNQPSNQLSTNHIDGSMPVNVGSYQYLRSIQLTAMQQHNMIQTYNQTLINTYKALQSAIQERNYFKYVCDYLLAQRSYRMQNLQLNQLATQQNSNVGTGLNPNGLGIANLSTATATVENAMPIIRQNTMPIIRQQIKESSDKNVYNQQQIKQKSQQKVQKVQSKRRRKVKELDQPKNNKKIQSHQSIRGLEKKQKQQRKISLQEYKINYKLSQKEDISQYKKKLRDRIKARNSVKTLINHNQQDHQKYEQINKVVLQNQHEIVLQQSQQKKQKYKQSAKYSDISKISKNEVATRKQQKNKKFQSQSSSYQQAKIDMRYMSRKSILGPLLQNSGEQKKQNNQNEPSNQREQFNQKKQSNQSEQFDKNDESKNNDNNSQQIKKEFVIQPSQISLKQQLNQSMQQAINNHNQSLIKEQNEIPQPDKQIFKFKFRNSIQNIQDQPKQKQKIVKVKCDYEDDVFYIVKNWRKLAKYERYGIILQPLYPNTKQNQLHNQLMQSYSEYVIPKKVRKERKIRGKYKKRQSKKVHQTFQPQLSIQSSILIKQEVIQKQILRSQDLKSSS